MLTLMEAEAIIGGLSTPSKMPGYSWSISAKECNVGSILRKVPGSTCSSCYALKGRYLFPNVEAAHTKRRVGLDHPQFVEAFIHVLTERYRRTRRTRMVDGKMIQEDRFRWFDSGDLPDLEALEKIVAIVRGTPQIKHWMPTRETSIVDAYLKKHGEFPSNLVVRISLPMIGVIADAQPMGLPFSTVDVRDKRVKQCGAAAQDNQCLNCALCWTGANVNYPVH